METMKKFVRVIFKILGVLIFLLVVADLALLSNITAEGIVITLGIVSALLLALIFLIKKKEGEQYGILGKIKKIFPGKAGEENKKNLTWAFFVGAVVLLIIITLPIEGNHEAIFPLVVALIVLVLISTVWPETFKSTVMRWAIYIYALVVMDLCFMNLFPVLMVKHAHFDPDWLKTTLVEKELYKLHKTEREIADQSRAREIARITEKVKRGENLSETEKQVVKDATESTLRPEEKKTREVAQSARKAAPARHGEKVETYVVYRDKWTMVRIPDHHYFYMDCIGKVAIDILDNHIPIKECDNRKKPVVAGNNIKPARGGSSGAFALQATEGNQATVTVTTWPM